MEKTRDEMVNEMIKNIQDQKQDMNLSEIALPGIDMQLTNKRVTKNEEEG